ncbi:MAG: sugar ABC transporter permease, partial [Bifidobacteriaceae bacterium]|nr:sugar ABC transporter permease [Bifidobacteriaceae bacterium]
MSNLAKHKVTHKRNAGKQTSGQQYRSFIALLLSPAYIVLLLLVVLPLCALCVASVTNFNSRSLFTGEFDLVGLAQYQQIFSDSSFYYSLGITFAFAIVLVTVSMLVGMWFAQILHNINAFLRVCFLVILVTVWAIPNIASALVWIWMFQPGYGINGWILSQLHIFGDVRNLSWNSN